MSDAAVPERADDGPGPDEALASRRLAKVATDAVASLPPRQRAAIVLTYYEELSNAAAAQVLKMNVKAFESLLVRARAALRRFVDEAGLVAADIGAAP